MKRMVRLFCAITGFLFFMILPRFVMASEGTVLTVNPGDTAWVLISTALVFLMTPGLAFFYGGLVRKKNILSVLMQCFMLAAMITLQWILFGYSLSFGPDVKGLIGNLNWAGLHETVFHG